ncbi:MAG: hypothetical protein JST08_01440 [Actinobacteria bacterium]|nr:hypothetical protein [Actinomycetota bacterium]
MRKRLSVAVALAVTVATFIGAGSASAATEFGSGCVANGSKEGAVWISTGHSPDSPLPVTAPVSGVITEWKVNSSQEAKLEAGFAGEFPRIFQPRLLVLRRESPESFNVVAEASGGPLNLSGTNTYLSRVPVQAGDYLGLAGNPYALFCETKNEADTFGYTIGGTPVGSTFKVQFAKSLQVPVVARIEPDVDGDGYGDETQDQCPQSAAYQTACPVVTVSSLSMSHPKAVTVYVAISLSAPVAVTGTVKLGKDKTTTLRSRAQTVAPGTLARFNLAFTKPVLKTLKALTTKKSLTVTVAASATNLTGTQSTATSKLKLRGQKAPALHRQPRHKKPAKTTAPKHKHQ